MLSVEDWTEIGRLHRAGGLPIKTIAWTLGSRGTRFVAHSRQTRRSMGQVQDVVTGAPVDRRRPGSG